MIIKGVLYRASEKKDTAIFGLSIMLNIEQLIKIIWCEVFPDTLYKVSVKEYSPKICYLCKFIHKFIHKTLLYKFVLKYFIAS